MPAAAAKVKDLSAALLSRVLSRDSGRDEEKAVLRKLSRDADKALRVAEKEGSRALVDLQRRLGAEGNGLKNFASEVWLAKKGPYTS